MTAVYFCPQVPWSPIKTLSDQGHLCEQLIYSPCLTGTGCPELLKSCTVEQSTCPFLCDHSDEAIASAQLVCEN